MIKKSTICPRCKKDEKRSGGAWCKKCYATWAKEHERKFQYGRKRAWLMRKKALLTIGNECENCGEKDIRVLQINHLKGGGSEERKGKNRKRSSHKFYRDIVIGKRKLDDLNILCSNCNIIYEYERGRLKAWSFKDLPLKYWQGILDETSSE